MRIGIDDDNIYPEGTFLSACVAPGVQLKVMSYRQRIYYCAVVGQPERKQLVYFEKELIPPNQTNSVVYTRTYQKVAMIKRAGVR